MSSGAIPLISSRAVRAYHWPRRALRLVRRASEPTSPVKPWLSIRSQLRNCLSPHSHAADGKKEPVKERPPTEATLAESYGRFNLSTSPCPWTYPPMCMLGSPRSQTWELVSKCFSDTKRNLRLYEVHGTGLRQGESRQEHFRTLIICNSGRMMFKAPPVDSKVLTRGRVGWEGVKKVVDSKRMTPATERDADESKDS
jgi:hypothetical protein